MKRFGWIAGRGLPFWMLLWGVAAVGPVNNVSANANVIEPGDVLSVRVDGQPNLSKEYTVDSQGNIQMDLAGKVGVAGLSPQKAQDKLSASLRDYLKFYDVSLSVTGDAGSKVLVFGEVTKPGIVKLQSGSRLLDGLAEAGQLTANADMKRITIIRKGGGSPVIVDLDAAFKDQTLNVELKPGDTITVPRKASNTVTVDGEVRTPGAKSLDEARTAYAALMSAGPTEHADWSRVQLRRRTSEVPLTVDLSGVRTGRVKDDLELQPGDQITIMSRFRGTATLRGEVKEPGEKSLTGHTQLLDFLATDGGGFTERSDRTNVQIIRDGEVIGKYNLEEVENGLRSSDDPEMQVRPGDIVFVPNDSKRRFAIVGGVRKPGSYPVREGMKLLDAVMQAEGFTLQASNKQFVIAPENPSDERIQQLKADEKSKSRGKKKDDPATQHLLVVDYGKLMKGDPTHNIEIKPGDRILIPEEDRNNRNRGMDNALRLLPLVGLFL